MKRARPEGAPSAGDRRRVHRVLVDGLAAGLVELHGPEVHHLGRVLRARVGDAVEAFDGRGGVAGGTIEAIADQRVTLRLEAPAPSAAEAPTRLRMAVALLKGDKLVDVVRQCTEVGAHSFQLLVTRYADVRELSGAKLERLRRVAAEAARQSGRAVVPEVHEPVRTNDLAWQGAALVADPRAATHVADAAAGALRFPQVTVLTGPEGGFSDDEVDDLAGRGAVPVGLGPRILRAETAPVALAATLLLGAVRHGGPERGEGVGRREEADRRDEAGHGQWAGRREAAVNQERSLGAAGHE